MSKPVDHLIDGLFIKGFSLCGARSAPHQKPPAMRVGTTGFTKPPPSPDTCDCSGRRESESRGRWWRMAQKAYGLSHTKWTCKYHVVFTPKYRRKVIYNQIRSDLGEIFRKL